MGSYSPYTEALDIIQKNPGTGGAGSLAKLVLSLYNELCGYSFAECVGNLDENLTDLAMRMVSHYATHGETKELRDVGKVLANDLFPGLWEMGLAMHDAREQTREKWRREDKAREAAEIIAAEAVLLNGEYPRVPLQDAQRMIHQSEGFVYAYYHQEGNWLEKKLSVDDVIDAIKLHGTSITAICPESSYMLAVKLDNRLYYISTQYEARESYLASIGLS